MILLDLKRYALIIIMTFITEQARSLTLRPWEGEKKISGSAVFIYSGGADAAHIEWRLTKHNSNV